MKGLLKIKDLNYQNIFTHFSLAVKENSVVMISGNNKCGKTTLIKIIGQIIPTVDTVKYTFLDPFVECGKMGVLLHQDDDNSGQTVLNVLQDNDDVKVPIFKCRSVASFCSITDILDKKVKELNAFDKVKLWLAKELLLEPKLLLLDDPCLFLTNVQRKTFLELLLNVKKKLSCTIIMTTSSLKDTVVADYLYIMDQGKIVLEGNPFAIYREEHILNHLGLEIPFMVDLSFKLQFYNLINEVNIDVEGMVNYLWPSD